MYPAVDMYISKAFIQIETLASMKQEDKSQK